MRGRKSISRARKQARVFTVFFDALGRVKGWIVTHKVWSIVIALLLVAAAVFFVLWNLRPDDTDKQLSPAATEYQKQLPDLEKKVAEKPDDAVNRKNYAVALYATGETSEAAKQYEEAIRLNGKDAVAYNNLGNAYRDLKKTNEAVEAYKKSLELNPKSLNTYTNLANVQQYSLDNPEAAIETYKQGLIQLPENSQLELLLGKAYEQVNDVTSAKKTYEHILSYEPENKSAEAALSRINK